MEFRGIAQIPNIPMSITPPSPYGGSIVIGGYGVVQNDLYYQYLNVDMDSDFAFGTGDFTIEFYYMWLINPSTLPNTPTVMAVGNIVQGYSWSVKMWGGLWYMNLTGPSYQIGTRVRNKNEGNSVGVWYHAAFVRKNGTITSYLNGQPDSASQWSNTPEVVYDSAKKFCIGLEQMNNGDSIIGGGLGWPGKFTNLRILKGVAAYDGAFTPSSTPLTSITGTKLLMNVASAQTMLVDSSSNNKNINNGPTGRQPTYSSTSPFPFSV